MNKVKMNKVKMKFNPEEALKNELINFVNKNMTNGPKIILEFGSFDGKDGLKYKELYPNSEVHSIEPCPDLFKNLIHLKNKNINIHNYAITDTNGEIDFYQTKFYSNNNCAPSGSTLKITKNAIQQWKHIKFIDKPIKVKGITIETFCIENKINNIDLMHVDTQGNIINIIKGFGKYKPKILFAEVDMYKLYTNADNFIETEKILYNMNYKLIFKKGYNALFYLK